MTLLLIAPLCFFMQLDVKMKILLFASSLLQCRAYVYRDYEARDIMQRVLFRPLNLISSHQRISRFVGDGISV